VHPASLEQMKKAKALIVDKLPAAPIVLDVGGRNNSEKERSYKELWPEAEKYWVADLEDGPNVHVVMMGPYRMGFMDDGFDLIVSGQTLEHVANPFKLVREMKRVLKPGGYMILIAPSAGYAHTDQDCWRFMRDAFKAIADDVGMETVADWIYTGDSGGGRKRVWDDHVWIGRKP